MIRIEKDKLRDLLNKSFELGCYGPKDLQELAVNSILESLEEEKEEEKMTQGSFVFFDTAMADPVYTAGPYFMR